MGGILAGFGVFGKKIRVFLGKFFGKEFVATPKPATPMRTRVLSWILILLAVIVALRFGSGFLVKTAPKHAWQRSIQRVFIPTAIVPPQTVVAQIPKATVVQMEKPAQNKPAQITVIPVQYKEIERAMQKDGEDNSRKTIQHLDRFRLVECKCERYADRCRREYVE